VKTVGIIGGLGPETTAEFYLELVFKCQAAKGGVRPDILIESVPLPLDIEEEAIAHGRGEDRCVPFIVECAKNLQEAGADFIVMPCNSLHAFIPELRAAVDIPVLSIVEETAAFLKEGGIDKVGILATAISLNHQIYGKHLEAAHIEQITPDDYDQARIGKIIYNLVSGRHSNTERQQLISIVDKFEAKGIKHVLLACTDLQILVPSHPQLKIYDTMEIFANATAREMLK
jgi:aspartate racemase